MAHTLMHKAIGIDNSGQMGLIGFEDSDPLHLVVARVTEAQKAGKQPAETDLELLADLPVMFQKDCDGCVLSVVEIKHRF